MAKSFGLFLKEYEGTSWRGRYAAKHWRTALRNDYLKASHYTNERDVMTRLRLWEGDVIHFPQGVSTVWLEFRAQQRVEAIARRAHKSKV